jgi:Mg2+-importing ATPase
MTKFEDWTKLLRTNAATREALLRVAAADPSGITTLFKTDVTGLELQDVINRRKRAGRNILSTKKALAWWQLLLIVIPNPFNILLGLIAIISVSTPPPSWSTFLIIMIIVLISCIVRFWQEYRSSIAVVRLLSGVTTEVTVRRREGVKDTELAVDVTELVPGDIILLNPGDNVPADCLLLETSHLQIAQSSLTGESEPVSKTNRLMPSKSNEALFDLDNIAFMGTSVISGSATALVVATGDNAFIASITKQLNKKRPISAFERGIRHITYMMMGFMIIMVTIVLVIQGKLSHNWGNAALFSVSVAVGIVPEMLPAIVNTNLARGAFLLSNRRSIVKRLEAVQNLGGMTVLCSDKTGTLTKDKITLCHYENCDGDESKHVLQLAYTNAIFQSGKKNSIDSAIINKLQNDEGLKPVILGERISEISFDFEKRRSSAIIRNTSGKVILICKGAFEEILSLCNKISVGVEMKTLDRARSRNIFQRAHAKNDDGYRVLAVATRTLSSVDLDEDDRLGDLESDMTFEGLLTFLDPPKEDAADSITALQNLGVEVKVLTGDNLRIASRVCRSLNIASRDLEGGLRAITGPELARLEGDFHETVRSCTIFAKLTPTQKGDVVMSLKKTGQVVGMLGDGINDCVALRDADVGISVDSAVNVAKDCADVIMTEKDLSIIVAGVRTGRITHGNTMKYIKMVASSNFGNVFSVVIASTWLPYQPMSSLQILMQNLLYDVSQVALPWDHMDEEFLQIPRSWNTWDLLRFIIVLGPTSSTIDMCTFSFNWFYYGIRTASSPLVPRAHTHWFLEGLLTQTLIVHLLRTAKVPFFQSWASPVLITSTLVIMTVGLVIPYIKPVAHALGMMQPASSFLGFLAAELVLYCFEVQLVKVVYKKIFGTWL